MTNPAPLSPAAQAVFDAWIAPARFPPPKESGFAQKALAAALRAAALQIENSSDGRGCLDILRQIAAELEGAQ